MTGGDFGQLILVALSQDPNIRLWRQNVGLVKKADGGMFRAGPPKGAADLSGIVAPSGRRLEIEVKGSGDKMRPEQTAWGIFVRKMGGLYVLAQWDKTMTRDENVNSVVTAVREAS